MVLANYMESPNQLGYTTWAEINCSDTVKRGRELDRKRKEYNKTYNNVKVKLDNLKASGVSQQGYELLTKEFDNLLTEKQTLENTLKVETTLTKAVTKSPELYYQEFLDNGGKLSGFWGNVWGGIKRTVGGISKVVTLGESCNGTTKREFERDQKDHNDALKRLKLIEGELKALQNTEAKTKDYTQSKIPVVKKSIEILKKAIEEQKQKRNAVMLSYQAKKRAEELALREKAEKEKALAEQQSKAKQLATKEAKTTQTAGLSLEGNNNKILIGLAVVGISAYMILSKNKDKK